MKQLLVLSALLACAPGCSRDRPCTPAPSPGPVLPAPAPLPPEPCRDREFTLTVYTISGCPACESLKNSLRDPEVGSLLREHYTLVEVKDRPLLAARAGVTSYPTLVVTSRPTCQPSAVREEGRRTGAPHPHALREWLHRLTHPRNP